MGMGIRGRLFLVSLALIAVAGAVADVYLESTLERRLTAGIADDLFVRAALVERAATASRSSLADRVAWDRLADELGPRAGARVTFIRRDGVVLGDTDLDGAALLGVENHATRPEVRSALARGRGMSARFSSTIQERMLYVAVPFRRDGAVAGVARLALPLTAVAEARGELRRVLLVANLLAIAVAVLMSLLAAELSSRPLRQLTAVARRLASGDLAARSGARGGGEVSVLGGVLDRLAGNLSETLAALRGDRDLLNGVLSGMREGVLLLDASGHVVLVNPALREMLLLGPDPRGRRWLELVRNPELTDLLDRARRGREAVSGRVGLLGVRPRQLLVHAAPAAALTGPDGRTAGDAGLLAVFVDVTDLRRLELVRRDFVANVSHELRTPITAIQTAAETLQTAPAHHPEATPQLLGIIERSAERLRRLVDELLELARLEAAELRLEPEAIELEPFLRRVIEPFAESAARKRIAVEVAADGPLEARADQRALERIVGNLLDNALKYCPPDSHVRVSASAGAASSVVEVRVADDGPGIEARHLGRVFERFYRIDAGRSRELGGAGLGLSIVKHLAEASGGSARVESRAGAGTTFVVTLPRA